MALAAAWRDPRFSRPGDRKAFESLQGSGAAHGAMISAGLGAKERSASLAPLQTSQALWSTPKSPWRSAASPGYGGDPRFLPGRGPRSQTPSLEHRRRRTSEFCASRGDGGGHHCCEHRDMRPAGIASFFSDSQNLITGWKGNEPALQRKALGASSPELRALIASWQPAGLPSREA
mmetsp:Transcript_18168/g.37140  ORF Transcript_18168/g.37140 Transcript_18168/m.37140 type:complete len:176 (-) Transcript_18168:95-622(-)